MDRQTSGDAAAAPPPGLVKKLLLKLRGSASGVLDLFAFMRSNKKWWLIPILVLFILMSGIILFAATEAAPFIYTLF